jgi:hypothetical protein
VELVADAIKGTMVEHIWKDHYEPGEQFDPTRTPFVDQLTVGKLAKYSIKMDCVISSLMRNRNKLHIVFSQYYQMNIPFARALNANGFTQYQIGDKPDRTKRRYLFLTGSSSGSDEIYDTFNLFLSKHVQLPTDPGSGKSVYPRYSDGRPNIVNIETESEGGTMKNEKQLLINAFNNIDNIEGDICQLVILNTAAAEGITLKQVRFVHLLHNPANISKLFQIVGRAIRNCTHETNPERNVLPLLYLHDHAAADDQREIDGYNERVNKNDKFIPVLNLVKKAAIDNALSANINTDPSNPCPALNAMGPTGITPFALDIDMELNRRVKTDATLEVERNASKLLTKKTNQSVASQYKSQLSSYLSRSQQSRQQASTLNPNDSNYSKYMEEAASFDEEAKKLEAEYNSRLSATKSEKSQESKSKTAAKQKQNTIKKNLFKAQLAAYMADPKNPDLRKEAKQAQREYFRSDDVQKLKGRLESLRTILNEQSALLAKRPADVKLQKTVSELDTAFKKNSEKLKGMRSKNLTKNTKELKSIFDKIVKMKTKTKSTSSLGKRSRGKSSTDLSSTFQTAKSFDTSLRSPKNWLMATSSQSALMSPTWQTPRNRTPRLKTLVEGGKKTSRKQRKTRRKKMT